MAFSKITITYNEDLVSGDNISFTSSENGVITYNWVVGTPGANQVSVGTPTTNIGERSAINFSDRYVLERGYPLYLVNQSINAVEIISISDTDILSGGTSNKNVGFIIQSVIELPVDILKRINVRSPYFLHAPIYDGTSTIFPESVVFNVFIYEGDVTTDKPSTPTVVLTKQPRFLNDQNIYVDISDVTSDFINNKYSGVLTHQSVFVVAEIQTTYSSGVINEVTTLLAYDGFNIHSEGVNFSSTDDLMISNSFITTPFDGCINLPFYLGGDNYTVEFRNGLSIEDSVNVNSIIVIDTDNTVFNAEILNVTNVDNIRIANTTQSTESILDVEVVTECIYDPIKLTFVNRYGAKQDFWFYKVSKNDIKTKAESFNSNVLESSIVDNKSVLNYDTTRHNKKTFNKQVDKTITLNTGYIPEDNNIVIEEILASEYIWLTINNVVIPVNLTTKSLSLLTKRNDQLIKYSLKFDYSYSEIQNIR